MKGHSTTVAGGRPSLLGPSFRPRPDVLGWINVVVGAWVFATPFVGADLNFVRWSNGASGIVATIVAVLAGSATPGHGWVAGVTGVWLLFSSLFHGATSGAPGLWNNFLFGSFISLAGLVGAVRAWARWL